MKTLSILLLFGALTLSGCGKSIDALVDTGKALLDVGKKAYEDGKDNFEEAKRIVDENLGGGEDPAPQP